MQITTMTKARSGRWDEWLIRNDFIYLYSHSVEWGLHYHYRNRFSDVPGNSYYENMVLLTITKVLLRQI